MSNLYVYTRGYIYKSVRGGTLRDFGPWGRWLDDNVIANTLEKFRSQENFAAAAKIVGRTFSRLSIYTSSL
jgi:hypothetical protein